MSKLYLVYGTEESDLSGLQERLCSRLNITFTERESGYWGGLYYKTKAQTPLANEFMIHMNKEEVGNAPIFDEYSSYPVLLQCNDVRDRSTVHEKVLAEGFSLVKEREV